MMLYPPRARQAQGTGRDGKRKLDRERIAEDAVLSGKGMRSATAPT